MASKKIPISPAPEDKELEQRVSAMMEPDAHPITPATPAPVATTVPASAPPLDIFKDLKSAPQVPARLLEEIGAVPFVAETPVSPKKVSIAVTEHTDDTTAVAVTTKAETPADTEGAVPDDAESAVTPAEPLDETATEAEDIPEATIDDATTDAVIDEITAKEADQLLEVQDAAAIPAAKPASKEASQKPTLGAKKKKAFLKRRMVWVVVLLLLLGAVFGVPASRYKVVGLVIKKPLLVAVVDSTSNTPVSNARVMIDGKSVVTDGNGKAKLSTAVGKHQVVVAKQYYATTSQSTFVALRRTSPLSLKLVAIGRQVPIKVLNKLTGKPLPGAEIKVLNTSAKTDKNGQAIIVLPAKNRTESASISAEGYNGAKVNIQITSNDVAANSFTLVPAGKVYFLSNENGTIDVVKANLDGSNRQTVLKGTGKEDAASTVLLASRDWRYMVLRAQRDSSQAALYLLDSTNNDKVVEFDSGDATFTPIGWQNHNFMYDMVRNSVSTAQNGHELLKSYDAERGQLNQLDQTQAEGTTASYVYQGFYNFYVLDNLLVYNTQWYSSGNADLGNHSSSIRGVQPNGQNKKDYQTFGSTGVGYIQAVQAKPQEIYYGVYNYTDTKTTYYHFKDQAVKTTTDIGSGSFNKVYPNYVVAPSGNQALWTEMRDGKNTVLIGDGSAAGAHQLLNLSGYSAYGWFGDDYLLVSKNNSELFIVAAKAGTAPSKLTDYYKSNQNFSSYGGL